MIIVARCRCGLTSLSTFALSVSVLPLRPPTIPPLQPQPHPTTPPQPHSQTTPTTTTYAEPVPKVRELRSGFHGATEWADFRIAERDYNPAQAVKRNSNLSPEQRAAAGERLRASREVSESRLDKP